ncbi:MAG: alkaline phosphatase family protein [Deltaproteobacteria bacterium]|nr:alkaline phosphatase family protein [Deltaproteobacteria bacterium]
MRSPFSTAVVGLFIALTGACGSTSAKPDAGTGGGSGGRGGTEAGPSFDGSMGTGGVAPGTGGIATGTGGAATGTGGVAEGTGGGGTGGAGGTSPGTGGGGAIAGTGGRATTGGAGGGASGGGGAAGSSGAGGAVPDPAKTTVVLFLVDGVMYEAVQTAIAAGAPNLGFVLANGVRVVTSHSTSPAAAIQLPTGAPGGTMPWARATSGNVSVHTGCHLFESNQMDDIFLAARAAGIKSVFSGGDANYAIFTTADYHYGTMMNDDVTVQRAIDHLRNDRVRLLRVHLQRVRDSWTGPANKTNASSAYIRQLIVVDGLLGRLIQALKDVGVWESTYLVLAADHGMGQAAGSTHPASTPSSWDPFMMFYGPGLKRGTTIPYAELPDIAVTTIRFFGLPPLRGHLDPAVNIPVKGPTGTVLTNLFVGAPADVAHPRYIEKCLNMGTACTSSGDDFAPYRQTMLNLIR